MKTSTFALLAVVSSASANLPSLSIKIADGNFDDLGGLEPTISWSATSNAGTIDIEYGVEADAFTSSDLLASPPKNVWGKASTSLGGWGVTGRAEFRETDFSTAAIEIDAVNESMAIHVDAISDGDFNVKKIEATKSFDSDNSAVKITPRYDVDSGTSDVVFSYLNDDTAVEITASKDDQTITISKQINDENRVAPTIRSNGELFVEWERNLGDDNSITTTVNPNESIDVKWNDGGWVASVNMPLDGISISGVNISIKKDVFF